MHRVLAGLGRHLGILLVLLLTLQLLPSPGASAADESPELVHVRGNSEPVGARLGPAACVVLLHVRRRAHAWSAPAHRQPE